MFSNKYDLHLHPPLSPIDDSCLIYMLWVVIVLKGNSFSCLIEACKVYGKIDWYINLFMIPI